jgi:AraC-like DNA-binding protein
MSASPKGEIQPYNAEPAHIPLFYIFFNWAIVLIGLIYVALLLSLIKSYHQRIKNLFSTIERVRLDWLQIITYATLATWTMFTVENALFTVGINFSNFDISSLMVGLCVYSVGYWGLMKSEVFVSPDVVSALAEIDIVNPSPINLSEDRIKSTSLKYEKSGLSQEDARQYSDRVKQLMEKEHLYTDSNLTLGKLANRLSISSHNLSEVINTQLQQNFYDFVNRYRVEQVKRDLLDPAKQHLTIIALAFDAGFNSKAAFNTVFKEYTNQTPSEYRKAYLEIPSKS